MARLHDSGVAHPDPHPGNLLVETRPGRAPRFALIDLHAVYVGRPLTRGESNRTSSSSIAGFSCGQAGPTGAAFWHAYRRAALYSSAADGEELRRAKELSATRSPPTFASGPAGRIALPGLEPLLPKIDAGPFRGFAVRDLPEAFLHQVLADPDAALKRPDMPIFKDSRTSTVAVLMMPTADGPVPVVLKRVNVRSRIEPFKNLLRSSQVLRSWINGHTLRDRCLPTPRPLAVFHRYRAGLPTEGYLLTELVAEPVTLGSAEVGRATLARLLRAMHDRGVSHRDLKSANVLLAHGREPVLIDLVGVRTARSPRRKPACQGTGAIERQLSRFFHHLTCGSAAFPSGLSGRRSGLSGGLEKLVEDGIAGHRRQSGQEPPQRSNARINR